MISTERLLEMLKQIDPFAVRVPKGFMQFATLVEAEVLRINAVSTVRDAFDRDCI